MATGPDPLELAAALQVSLGLFLRRLRQTPVTGDLTTPELTALSRLDRAGPATPGDLASAEQITPQGMGATVTGLVRRGLVERNPDPGDGRRVVVSLTPAGRRLMQTKRSARSQQIAALLQDGFSGPELEILAAAAPLIERLASRI